MWKIGEVTTPEKASAWPVISHVSLLQTTQRRTIYFSMDRTLWELLTNVGSRDVFHMWGALLTILSQWTRPTGTSRCVLKGQKELAREAQRAGSLSARLCVCRLEGFPRAFLTTADNPTGPGRRGRPGTEGALLSVQLNTASAPAASHMSPGLGCSLGSRQLAWELRSLTAPKSSTP